MATNPTAPPLRKANERTRMKLDKATYAELMEARRQIKNILTQAYPALTTIEAILDLPENQRWQADYS